MEELLHANTEMMSEAYQMEMEVVQARFPLKWWSMASIDLVTVASTVSVLIRPRFVASPVLVWLVPNSLQAEVPHWMQNPLEAEEESYFHWRPTCTL